MDIKALKKISDYEWEIEKTGEMNVPARIYADEKLVTEMDEKVREQLMNVASLPGIVKAAMAMPDAHWGYGFPIGGVGAFDEDEGILSVGGVGFDISCGVRTMRTGLKEEQVKEKIEEVVNELFRTVPAGLGSTGEIKLTEQGIDEVLEGGAVWAVEQGYGTKRDLEFIEEFGRVDGADASKVSHKAKKRQYKQVGTLGSGNHYLEIQVVDEVFDEKTAKVFKVEKGDVLISFHCGSRALGHQIGMDYLPILAQASKKYGIPIRDRELVCAPIKSKEGQDYWGAMNAGINCALANRQVIAHLARTAFEKVLPEAKVETLYDISHNTCKIEEHDVDGEKRKLYVHRKGATRAFGPGRKELPKDYMEVGQPVLIGGSMGTYSYILVGTETGTSKTFGSACHGGGRRMSRTKAKHSWRGEEIIRRLREKGIIVKAHSYAGVAEEAPEAYKDVAEVVDAVHNAGLAKKVVRVRPIGCIKG